MTPQDPRTPEEWAMELTGDECACDECAKKPTHAEIIRRVQEQARRQALEEAAQLAEKHVHTWIMGECHYAAGVYAGDQIRELLRDETSEEK